MDKDMIDELDALLTKPDDEVRSQTAPDRKPPEPTAANVDLAIEKLKARINGQASSEAHPSDAQHDADWLRQVAALFGEIAAHARMFAKDPRNGHQRTPDEVKTLLATLVRSKGTGQVFDWIFRGFKPLDPLKLPEPMLRELVRLFPELPAMLDGGAK